MKTFAVYIRELLLTKLKGWVWLVVWCFSIAQNLKIDVKVGLETPKPGSAHFQLKDRGMKTAEFLIQTTV